jgi:hypothetical protein
MSDTFFRAVGRIPRQVERGRGAHCAQPDNASWFSLIVSGNYVDGDSGDHRPTPPKVNDPTSYDKREGFVER